MNINLFDWPEEDNSNVWSVLDFIKENSGTNFKNIQTNLNLEENVLKKILEKLNFVRVIYVKGSKENYTFFVPSEERRLKDESSDVVDEYDK